MQLETIDDQGHELSLEAANDWARLKADAEKAGHVVRVNSAGRSIEKQRKLYTQYIQAVAAWERSGRMGARPTAVAPPGGSEHNDFIAVDVNVSEPKFFRWLLTNSTKYNFWFTAARERWHLAHYSGQPPRKLLDRHNANVKSWS